MASFDVHETDSEKPHEFDVVFHNEAIVPWATVAPAGPVTFAVLNEDPDDHDFLVVEIEPERQDQVRGGHLVGEARVVGEIGPLAKGEERVGTFDLEPGRYVICCKEPGHGGIGGGLDLTVQPVE
jgi:uncharacterized cupredoxin-like copper-binding protein